MAKENKNEKPQSGNNSTDISKGERGQINHSIRDDIKAWQPIKDQTGTPPPPKPDTSKE